jgi:hypothetical protein
MRRVEGCRAFVMDLGFPATAAPLQSAERLACRSAAALAKIEGLPPDRAIFSSPLFRLTKVNSDIPDGRTFSVMACGCDFPHSSFC